jgi:GNAT superfamily N-acetyltransferase
MPCVIVQSETASDRMDEARALLHDHWQELATDKELMALAPDVQRYREMERKGVIFALYAYLDGALVGYSVNFLSTNLHYRHLTYSQNDVLFLDAAHRGGRIGLRLIAETEQAAKARGAKLHIWHAKQGTPLDSLLPRLGYGVQDVLWSKVL